MLDSTVVLLPGKGEGEGLKVRRAVTHLSTNAACAGRCSHGRAGDNRSISGVCRL